MSYIQRFLNGFMEAEVFHSLGAYFCTLEKLEGLEAELNQQNQKDIDQVEKILNKETLRDEYKNYNQKLAQEIHKINEKFRHPCPPDPKGNLKHCVKKWKETPNVEHSRFVFDFYEFCKKILDKKDLIKKEEKSPNDEINKNLQKCIIYKPDFISSEQQKKDFISKYFNLHEELRSLRKNRFEKRLTEFKKVVEDTNNFESEKNLNELKKSFLNDNLLKVSELHEFIFRAMFDIHYRLHWIEHRESTDFKNQMKNSQKLNNEKTRILNYCICANTFLYTLTRTAPWIFAEDNEERDAVFELCHQEKVHLAPPRCIWLAYQISLISLYRRAHSRILLGKNLEAFNDYHKVQRWARRIRIFFIDNNPTPLKGVKNFLAAIDALSEYRIGELYRSDHAYTQAFDHFNRAFDRLEELKENPEMDKVLSESRWRIDLILSMGKTLYELGYIKRSLKWYVRAWRNFIKVVAIDSNFEVNDNQTAELENWLVATKNDPDIDKEELIKKIHLFVQNLKLTRIPLRLRGLAADILNRIAHTLYILKLGSMPENPEDAFIDSQDDKVSDMFHSLSFECAKLAYKYDPNNTLIKSKFLQIMKSISIQGFDFIKQNKENETHWTSGGSDFEKFSRVYEHYLLKEAIKIKKRDIKSAKNIANPMLVDFLSNTDSGSLKLSQIYRYLMQEPNPGYFENESAETRMEFICLKRYSSFFPFVPRPSSFHIIGGGYFIRIYNKKLETPIGIVVDPGPDFTENLYRSGHSLADIDIIIVSHDHADHSVSIDPILSLLGYKKRLGDTKFNDEELDKRLVIFGNKSIEERYAFFEKQEYKYAPLRVIPLKDIHLKSEIDLAMGKHNRLKDIDLTIESFDVYHRDLAQNNAKGIRISIKGKPELSIGITSDTGNHKKYNKNFKKILNSDIVIAHISSVPLTQLRSIAGVWKSEIDNETTAPDYEWLKEIWEDTISKNDKTLHQLIKFSLWLEDKKKQESKSAENKAPDETSPFGRIDEKEVGGSSHLYLSGIIEFAQKFMGLRKDNQGAFVISELREELASFRTKIAKGLNEHFFNKTKNLKAITADLGLRIILESDNEQKNLRVLCSSCEKDNDMTTKEKYHSIKNIREVCVKGEDEGIFYNCILHDPSSQTRSYFVEKMERYDVFKRPFNLI